MRKLFITFFLVFSCFFLLSQQVYEDKYMQENDTLQLILRSPFKNAFNSIIIELDIDVYEPLLKEKFFTPNFSGKILIFGSLDSGNFLLVKTEEIVISKSDKEKFRYFFVNNFRFRFMKILLISDNKVQESVSYLNILFLR